MDFRLKPEEESFRQEVLSFIHKELPPDWDNLDNLEVSPSRLGELRQIARKLGQRGWIGLSWPEEYGGRENPILDAILAQELAYYNCPARDVQGAGMVAPTIIKFGTDEQKRRHLPGIAKAEVFWSQGFSEPDAGSDLAGVKTIADDKGDYFIVNGQKLWTSFAHHADWIYLLARTDIHAQPKHRGISFFVSDVRAEGITIKPLLDMTGNHIFNEVFFDNVRIPRENLIGEKNRGFYIAMALMEFERSMAGFIGELNRLVDDLVKYAKEYGISPVLRNRLAQAAVETEVCRWYSLRNIWMQAGNMVFKAEPPMSKVFITEVLQRVCQLGMDILTLYAPLKQDSLHARLMGAIGYLYQQSLRETILAGTSEIQRNVVAERGLGLPRS